MTTNNTNNQTEKAEEQFLTPEWDKLALEVGQFMRYWGFKVIHGRIWTHIYLSDHPLDAGSLMKRFGLSKALMSLSLNDLLRYNVIMEGPKSSKGTQTYVANPEVLDVILNVIQNREKVMLEEIKKCQVKLSNKVGSRHADFKINPMRLHCLEKMVDQAQSSLELILGLSSLNIKDWEFMNETFRPSSSSEN